jgi:hypothetical protein
MRNKLIFVLAFFAVTVFADKKPEPKAGKIFIADPKTGKWLPVAPAADEKYYLICVNSQGKAKPCVIDAGPESAMSELLQDGDGGSVTGGKFFLRVKAYEKPGK